VVNDFITTKILKLQELPSVIIYFITYSDEGAEGQQVRHPQPSLHQDRGALTQTALREMPIGGRIRTQAEIVNSKGQAE
jgi:hypothetical protein